MINCFVAAICRAVSEGNDESTYFGSTAQLEFYIEEAKRLGFLDDDGKLTETGSIVGNSCQALPTGRAYMFSKQYEQTALNSFEEHRQDEALSRQGKSEP